MNSLQRFVNESTELLNGLPPQTGDAARLGHRLSCALTRIRMLEQACLDAKLAMQNMPQGSYRYACQSINAAFIAEV